MKLSLIVTVAAISLTGCKDKDKTSDMAAPAGADKTAPAPATGDGDCGTYAALVTKCANGAGDPKGLEMTCKATLKANNAMTASMKAQVACAKSNDACDAYAKCLATPPAP